MHAFNTQPYLYRYCNEEGIALAAFSPLGAPGYIELNMATAAEVLWDKEPVVNAA